MKEFRLFLIQLRKRYNKAGPLKYYGYLTLLSILFIIITGSIEVYVGRSFFLVSIIQSLLSVIIGVFYFSIGYVFICNRTDVEKETLREKFSFKQRINISIFSLIFIVLLSLLLFKPGSFLYPALFGIVVAGVISLLAFVRPSRTEMLNEEYGIPDFRDFQYEDFMRQKEEFKKAESEEIDDREDTEQE